MNPNDKNLDKDPASRAVDRNGSRSPHYNKNLDGKSPDSKTFNEDEESYENKKDGQKATSNNGTENNDWSANEPIERSVSERYGEENDEDERWGADYISSDHSNYNRNNSRFYWDDEDF